MDHRIGRRRFLTLTGAAVASCRSGPSRLPTIQSPKTRLPGRCGCPPHPSISPSCPSRRPARPIAGLGFEAIDIWSAHEGCPHLDDVASRLGPEGLKELLGQAQAEAVCLLGLRGRLRTATRNCWARPAAAWPSRAAPGRANREELTARMRQFIEGLETPDRAGGEAQLVSGHREPRARPAGLARFVQGVRRYQYLAATGDRPGPLPHPGGPRPPCPRPSASAAGNCSSSMPGRTSPTAKQLPGVGPTDMTPWIRALADVRYRGYVNPFMHGHPGTEIMTANLATARDYLKSCYAKVRETTDHTRRFDSSQQIIKEKTMSNRRQQPEQTRESDPA